MTRTVLITGASSGIGRETALRFQREGWNVAATMRSPEKETALNRLPGVICPALDVTRAETIGAAIVNVASFAGRSIFPLYSVYHASKWAVEGFCDSLQYEVKPYGIRVKIIEPGIVKTEFWGRSTDRANVTGITAYEEGQPVLDLIDEAAGIIATWPSDVAEAIWRATNDSSSRQCYVIGLDAHLTLFARKVLSDGMYRLMMNIVFSRRQVATFRRFAARMKRRES